MMFTFYRIMQNQMVSSIVCALFGKAIPEVQCNNTRLRKKTIVSPGGYVDLEINMESRAEIN